MLLHKKLAKEKSITYFFFKDEILEKLVLVYIHVGHLLLLLFTISWRRFRRLAARRRRCRAVLLIRESTFTFPIEHISNISVTWIRRKKVTDPNNNEN